MRRRFSCAPRCLRWLRPRGCGASAADLRLPAVFGDNMVLQRGQSVPVGAGPAPAQKSRSPSPASRPTPRPTPKASSRRRCRRWTPPGRRKWSSSPAIKRASFKNVLVGEVWVCSGQSNMEWPVGRVDQRRSRKSPRPSIRRSACSRCRHVPADKPQADCKGEWVECSPQSVPGFSAVGYFFGRELHKDLTCRSG